MMVTGKKYTFIKTLGAGTWGTVFEARDEANEIVAIKKLYGKDALRSGIDFTALRESIFLLNICDYKSAYYMYYLYLHYSQTFTRSKSP